MTCSLVGSIDIARAGAVELCGGPRIDVGFGRAETLEPAPSGRLPDKDDRADSLVERFAARGLTGVELVALSGAHTLDDAVDAQGGG